MLDLLEKLLESHGRGKGSLEERRAELRQTVASEREKLASLEQALGAAKTG